MHPCHQNLITQIAKLGTVMIKYRVQYVEKCNQKQRFWFICSENIKSILRRRNLDVKFAVECLALNENCRIIPILILEQDLICADFAEKILELVAPVGIMKNLALKQETHKTERLFISSFDRHYFYSHPILVQYFTKKKSEFVLILKMIKIWCNVFFSFFGQK